jgi:glucose-1-phosphate cytidylyltransferase
MDVRSLYPIYLILYFTTRKPIKNEDACQWFNGGSHMTLSSIFNCMMKERKLAFDFIKWEDAEPWKVTVVDTGLDTMTGGRIKRVAKYIGNETFCLTYGDGVCDVDVAALVAFHKEQGRVATLTRVQPEGRFGIMDIEGTQIQSFREKDKEDTGWINGGYMVLEPAIFDYIDGNECILERKPLETLAAEGNLDCYRHNGFWQCMDTLRDKEKLEKMISQGVAPWMYWK